MQYSVSQIGQEQMKLSKLRNEAPYFSADGFVAFAYKHREKYSIHSMSEELEMFVHDHYVDALIKDYKEVLNVASGKVKTKEKSINDWTQEVLQNKQKATEIAFMIGNNNCLISVINNVAEKDKDLALHMATYMLKLLQK